MSELDIYMKKIIMASRILYASNGITDVQTGSAGHVSRRIPNKNSYLVAGHVHEEGRATLGEVEYKDLLTIDIKTGKRLEGIQPLLGENIIHTAIYRSRNDVNSVIHVHPFWCVVWSLVEEPILDLPVLFTGRFEISSEEDGKNLTKKLGDERAVLLPGHGLITVGETIEQATVLTASLNEQAKKLYYASLLGSIPKQYVELLLRRHTNPTGGDTWLWYISKLKEKGIYPNLP